MTQGSPCSSPVISIEGPSNDYADKYRLLDRFHCFTSGTRWESPWRILSIELPSFCEPSLIRCHWMRFRRLMLETMLQTNWENIQVWYVFWKILSSWIFLWTSANSIKGNVFCFALFCYFRLVVFHLGSLANAKSKCQASRKHLHSIIPINLRVLIVLWEVRASQMKKRSLMLWRLVTLCRSEAGNAGSQQPVQLPSGLLCRHPSAGELLWGTHHRNEGRSFDLPILH